MYLLHKVSIHISCEICSCGWLQNSSTCMHKGCYGNNVLQHHNSMIEWYLLTIIEACIFGQPELGIGM